MATFTYPTSAEISQIAQNFLQDLTMDDPVFSIMPVKNEDTTLIMWEQEDDYLGLQQIRGMNGEPPKVQPVGAKQYQMAPGVYGEQLSVRERELTERRQYGTFGTPVSLDDIIMPKVRQMTGRQVARIKQINWTLLTTGTFSVSAANGAVVQTDTYTTQTFSSTVPWTTYATATPLADLQALALKATGYSLSFNSDATLFVNRVTANAMTLNTNSADLYGRRTAGLGTFNTLNDANQLFTGEDLPTIRIYDKGYKNDAGTFTRFIGNGIGVLVGKRDDGAPLGRYVMTRNANNPDMAPGPYMKITDSATPGNPHPVPRRIAIDAGHNGGPVMSFPSGIVIATFF